MERNELAQEVYNTSRLTGTFTLRSGQVSNQYFDKYLFESDPVLLMEIASKLKELIPKGTEVESELVEMFKEDYKEHSLDEFGVESYKGNLTSIMFNYWRSYLTVKYLVEVRANNDIKQVFKECHKWDQEGRKVTLTEYFGLNPVLK